MIKDSFIVFLLEEQRQELYSSIYDYKLGRLYGDLDDEAGRRFSPRP